MEIDRQRDEQIIQTDKWIARQINRQIDGKINKEKKYGNSQRDEQIIDKQIDSWKIGYL